MDEGKRNRVLFCPLGWGLGHASRLIPIISRFQKSGFDVIAAGDELQMQYISSYFLDIKTFSFPSFKVKLAKGSNQLFPLLGIAFKLPYHIIREHFALKKIIRENQINLIISDNRYGLWHKGIKSVLITHQLRVLFPKPFRFFEPVEEWFVRLISQKFSHCWIPDYADGNNLAGKLSHPSRIPINARYIGLLSRFQNIKFENCIQEWDMVGIVSGPSPQRELLIESITNLSKHYSLKTLIIMGDPKKGTAIFEIEGVFYVGHLHDIDFIKAAKSTKYLIARAGYSTIMDLVAIGVSGLIVPTPGQTEQEYLTDYLSRKGLFKTCNQRDLDNVDISISKSSSNQNNYSSEFLEKSFRELLSSLS